MNTENTRTVFVGGSKNIGHLSGKAASLLSSFVERGNHIFVGDCHGVDLAVQNYLHTLGYRNLTIYCAGEKCRFNVGSWAEKHVPTNEVGYAFFRAKDLDMLHACSTAFLIWNGSSRGTKNNLHTLRTLGKTVFLYRTDTDRLRVVRGKETI